MFNLLFITKWNEKHLDFKKEDTQVIQIQIILYETQLYSYNDEYHIGVK